MNEANNRQDAVNGRHAINVAEQHAVAESQILSKPMFLSEQFEAYLNLFDADNGGRVQRCVDAQELHQKLGVGKDFTSWIKVRIGQEELVDGVDFNHTQTGVVRTGRGTTNKSVYTLTLETAKIIAAMERNETGRKIRKWLVRVEEQARQTHTASPALSRIELLEMALVAERRAEAERQRADDAMHKALGLETKIATSTLYPKVAPEPGKAHISIKDIKAEYAPYLSEPKIRLVLRFYGQGRTRFQFGAHENASFQTFQRAGLEEVFDEFLKDCQHRVSGSRTSVILDHECFDGETARVPKNLAIEHLGYAEDDFAS